MKGQMTVFCSIFCHSISMSIFVYGSTYFRLVVLRSPLLFFINRQLWPNEIFWHTCVKTPKVRRPLFGWTCPYIPQPGPASNADGVPFCVCQAVAATPFVITVTTWRLWIDSTAAGFVQQMIKSRLILDFRSLSAAEVSCYARPFSVRNALHAVTGCRSSTNVILINLDPVTKVLKIILAIAADAA